MDEIDFTYGCPSCGVVFCGSMPSDQDTYQKNIECEECGHRFVLDVYVQIIVITE